MEYQEPCCTNIRTSCLHCGDELEPWGILANILPTFFCANCCTQFRGRIDGTACSPHTVSQSQALTLYGCTRDDLSRLNFASGRKPNGRSLVKLYLGAEVIFLGMQRNLQRKQKLETFLGISLDDLDPLLRIYLLEDYFQLKQPHRMTFDRLLRRYASMPRVVQILSSCPKADPEAVFDFCVAYPDAGPAEFREMKEKCKTVFRLVGMQIMKRLTATDRLKLEQTPLEDVAHEFENSQRLERTAHRVHLH